MGSKGQDYKLGVCSSSKGEVPVQGQGSRYGVFYLDGRGSSPGHSFRVSAHNSYLGMGCYISKSAAQDRKYTLFLFWGHT